MSEETLKLYLEQVKDDPNPFEKIVQLWMVKTQLSYIDAYREVREVLDKSELCFLTEVLDTRVVFVPRTPIKLIGTFNECRAEYERLLAQKFADQQFN